MNLGHEKYLAKKEHLYDSTILLLSVQCVGCTDIKIRAVPSTSLLCPVSFTSNDVTLVCQVTLVNLQICEVFYY